MKVLRQLWADEAGFVVSSELVLVGTMLVIGMIVGLTSLRNQVVQELGDLAIAIGNIEQSYQYSSVTGHTAATAGSVFVDQDDYCDGQNVDPPNAPAACINVNADDGILETQPLPAEFGPDV
jgi:hypothetical protein